MVPLVITITKDGSRIYTGNQLSNTVSIVNTTTKAVIDSIAVPNQPASVCLNSDETRLYVTNFQSNTVTVINTANNKILYTITVDKGPTAGNNFIADLQGCDAKTTFTITVNPNPTAISAKGNVTALTTVYGTPSATGTFSLSGTNLGEGILINAPAGFEVSADSLKFSKILLVGSAGDITPRKIYVRLAAAANAGTYNDVITLTSAGATSVNVPVTGIVTPAALTIAAKHIVKFYGAINPELIIIYTGFKNKDGANQLTTQPVVYTTATTTSPIGVYPITVSNATSANYKFLYVNNTLDIATGLQFPNTFTPNNDGINDIWVVKYIGAYPNARVEIFNRYGNKVYNSQANFTGWDGKFNGADLPASTYYYIIRPNDGTKPISGPVSIIR